VAAKTTEEVLQPVELNDLNEIGSSLFEA